MLVLVALIAFSSCDDMDVDHYRDYFTGSNNWSEPEWHTHDYSETLSDSATHFNKCVCGDTTEGEPHNDSDLDGLCDVCSHSVSSILFVSVTAEDHVNLTASFLEVERGNSIDIVASVSAAYSVTVTGAEITAQSNYGDLIIYTITVSNVQTNVDVILVTELLPECVHEWTAATCTAPATCALCGKIKGSALGHFMSSPTCTAPATCINNCGLTEGEALGHSMGAPECERPATCSRCGTTEGEPLGHDMAAATCISPSSCTRCGRAKGWALGHDMSVATCTSVSTCSRCNITEGTMLEHDMSVATCTSVSTCSGCGKTEGTTLPHNMSVATCTSISTCSECGKTEGTMLEHDMSVATCMAPSTCSYCGKTEGEKAPHNYTDYTYLAPTCTKHGYDMYACVCGALQLEYYYPAGHEGGEPTYTEEGVCTKCNEVYLPMLKLTYSAYGAVGNGVADDFYAIKATHEFANDNGLTVYAEPGKTYNLGKHEEHIVIKTNTVWDGATFIIDDSNIAPTEAVRGKNVFLVAPDSQSYSVRVDGALKAGQTNIGVTFKTPVLLYISNSNVKQYIRYGANANTGANQQELILVDENGNVDPSTPIMWDYDVVTSAFAYPIDDTPITISGGTFITRANSAPREYTYYARNIAIKRSNVTVTGMTHKITGEGESGAPYNGFLNISYCHNVLIENTVFTGHKVYKLSSNENNSMGSYDIALNSANKITFLNCSQTNSIHDTAYWGVMGSNYCKNLTYDGCVFSRFDAHQGTYNATIINSEIGHQKLSVIGQGTLYIENTIFHSDTVVALRSDYGSTWQGEIIFKNITVNNVGTPTLVSAGWVNHDFGYTCYLPEKIVVDGITLANGDCFYVLPNLPSYVADATVEGAENKNPLELTKTVVIANNPNEYKYYVSVNNELFADVVVEDETV